MAAAGDILPRLCGRQRLALFIAALCHDIEHPGVTAGYLVRARARMAAWYKQDLGLLERHHSLRAVELLACRDIPLLAGLDAGDRDNMRRLVRDLILATDMGRHAGILEQVRVSVQSVFCMSMWIPFCPWASRLITGFVGPMLARWSSSWARSLVCWSARTYQPPQPPLAPHNPKPPGHLVFYFTCRRVFARQKKASFYLIMQLSYG